jgi:hypothetical protein
LVDLTLVAVEPDAGRGQKHKMPQRSPARSGPARPARRPRQEK